MPAPTPTFTIIMPTRNQARWLDEAVRSVLEQRDAGRVELLVFDALSDDETPAILERHRARLTWLCAADAGQVDAINRGLRAARGEIVAWLNSDDLYLPGALRHVSAAFAADPDLDFVYGDVLEVDADGRILTPNLFTEECVAERYFCSHNFICQPTLFVRRRVLDRVGILRPSLRWFMDYEWISRLFRAGLRGRRLPHFLAANRDHPATKTNSGGFARWWEAMQVLAENPGPFLFFRPCVWNYSLEFVIKSLNAAGWAAPVEKSAAARGWRERLVDRLNARLLRMLAPRSFDAIVRRFGAEIAPHGPRVADLWLRAAPPTPPMPTPIPPAPDLPQRYSHLVAEAHDALRALLFPQLPLTPGRTDLMVHLLGTGIGEAMYVLAALHASLAEPGDVCEFGIAQGATSALLANEIRATDKQLWLYDSFQGLPNPAPQDQLKDDIFRLGSMARYEGEMRCAQDEVENRLALIGFPRERVQLRAGWIHETLAAVAGPRPVCFAYVDFDFYAPIAHTLAYLDSHLAPGGRIVVDDYDFFSTGAKTAVDEFIQRTGNRWQMELPQGFAGKFCLLRRRTA